MKRVLKIVSGFVALIGLSACQDDASVASRNLSRAADNFEILQNIVVYNTWTDTEVVVITGLCSIGPRWGNLVVICKEGPALYKRHYLGRSDNLSFFAVQLESVNVSTFHTRIAWKPQGFIPNIDLRVSADELSSDKN